jgi:hypothetical protein
MEKSSCCPAAWPAQRGCWDAHRLAPASTELRELLIEGIELVEKLKSHDNWSLKLDMEPTWVGT